MLSEHYRHTSDGVAAPTKSTQTVKWILSRSLYRTKSIALANVEAKRRAAAIQLELAAWTPFRQTGHYVIPQGANETHAWLFAWDQDGVDNAQAQSGVAEKNIRLIPEAALRAPTAKADAGANARAIHIYTCLDGIEAVVERNGIVTDSQWWAATPSQTVWANFQRVAGMSVVEHTDAFPAFMQAPWMALPVGYARGQAGAPDALREIWIIAVAAMLLAIPTIWFLNDYRRHVQALSLAESRLASTEQELNGLLGARGIALDSMARVARFDAVFNQPDALALFADVSRLLASISKLGTLVLTEWDWRSDGNGNDVRSKRLKMVFTVNGTAPTATMLVKTFEANPAFQDVQVNSEGSRLSIELRVVAHPDTESAPVSASLPAIPAQVKS